MSKVRERRRRTIPWDFVNNRIELLALTLRVSRRALCRKAGHAFLPTARRVQHHPNAPPAYYERIGVAWGMQPEWMDDPDAAFIGRLRGINNEAMLAIIESLPWSHPPILPTQHPANPQTVGAFQVAPRRRPARWKTEGLM